MSIHSAAAFATLVFLFGCGASVVSHESVAKETSQLMKEMMTTLETITDKSSAEAAKPKLEKIGKSLEELEKKQAALGKATPEVEAKLTEQMKTEEAEWAARMQAWTMKMMQRPEAMAALGDVMEKVHKAGSGR